MVAVALLGLCAGTVLAVILVAFSRWWPIEVAYVRVSWIPLAALVGQAVFIKPLVQRLSYFVIVPPILTCIVSLFLVVIGATLLAAARQRGERIPRLLGATIVAGIPGLLLVAYVLVSFLGSWRM